jgi:glyceraldehyde-3-phosphate dehydrogenase (NADP+)
VIEPGAAFRGSGPMTSAQSVVDGSRIGEVRWLDGNDFEPLLALAANGFKANAALPSWRRADILRNAAEWLGDHGEDAARMVVHESGKTIREARDEVRRSVDTLLFSGEESRRMAGELINFEAQYRGEGVVGWSGRFPLGVIVGATPFNAPLILAAHKVGPAFAVGNSVIIKPSPKTPLSADLIGEAMLRAGAPDGAVTVAPVPNDLAGALFGRPEVDLVSFTGRYDVGWDLRRRLPEKRMVLELGSNGACIVAVDAKVAKAADACVRGAMAAAGQVCASIQRVFVDSRIADQFVEEAKTCVSRLKVGDPLDEDTDVGPLFDEPSAARAIQLIEGTVAAGAAVVCGGERSGKHVMPCILDHVTDDMDVACDEAFAPVMAVLRFQTLDEAISRSNASPFGLQAAIFSSDIATIMECYRRLEAGTVVANRHHAWRVDHMPFGGWKQSGRGREGIREAMLEFSQTKVLAIDWQA